MTFDSSFSLTFDAVSAEGDDRSRQEHLLKSGEAKTNGPELVFGSENNNLRAFLESPENLEIDNLFPLCLFGPSGTGKSELVRWIVKKHCPLLDSVILSAADFYRDYVESLELDSLVSFRSRFCADGIVTVIEGIEEMAARPRGLDELEFLLDHCERLVVTSSENPADINGFPYRLASRVLGGLSIPIAHPAPEIRKIILKNELAASGGTIDDLAAGWLVEQSAVTIPEIKQIVSRLRIQVDFSKPITLKTIKRIFGTRQDDTPSLASISKLVAKNQRLKITDLKSQSRKRSIVQARGIAVFIAREKFGYKYEELGRYFGNRDHSTIMHAHRKFKMDIDDDVELNRCVENISSDLLTSHRDKT